MRKEFILMMCLALLFACNKTDNDKQNDLVSKWKLIEVLADPGDGSGTFQPIESDLIIEFYKDGTIKSNGLLCYMTLESSDETFGTYSTVDNTISPDDCNHSLDYSLDSENSQLIISYPCIEPCGLKFIKIQ